MNSSIAESAWTVVTTGAAGHEVRLLKRFDQSENPTAIPAFNL